MVWNAVKYAPTRPQVHVSIVAGVVKTSLNHTVL